MQKTVKIVEINPQKSVAMCDRWCTITYIESTQLSRYLKMKPKQIDRMVRKAVQKRDTGLLNELYEDVLAAREAREISARDNHIFQMMFDEAFETIGERL